MRKYTHLPLKTMPFLNNRLCDTAVSLQLTFNILYQERAHSQKILWGFLVSQLYKPKVCRPEIQTVWNWLTKPLEKSPIRGCIPNILYLPSWEMKEAEHWRYPIGFFNPAMATPNFVESRNPDVFFFGILRTAILSIRPYLTPILLKKSWIPRFKYGKSRIPKNLLGTLKASLS